MSQRQMDPTAIPRLENYAKSARIVPPAISTQGEPLRQATVIIPEAVDDKGNRRRRPGVLEWSDIADPDERMKEARRVVKVLGAWVDGDMLVFVER